MFFLISRIFCFHSVNLLMVAFLWIYTAPCCSPSPCCLLLLSAENTAWCLDLLSVKLPCFSVLSSSWVTRSFTFNLHWWYLSVVNLVLLCFPVSVSVTTFLEVSSWPSFGRGRPFWLQAGKKYLHVHLPAFVVVVLDSISYSRLLTNYFNASVLRD